MTKSFDEWVVDAESWSERDCYEAGQKSRQAEVDELQLKLSEDSRVLHNVIDIERRKCEELQKRIDEALKSSKEFYDFGDGESAMAFCNEIMNILKGDSHESR